MKKSTKHQVEGKVLEMKGTMKAKIGAVTDDAAMKASGVADKAVGKATQALGAVEAKLGK